MVDRVTRWIGTLMTIGILVVGGLSAGSTLAPAPAEASGLCDFENCRVGECNENTLDMKNCEDGPAFCEATDCDVE